MPRTSSNKSKAKLASTTQSTAKSQAVNATLANAQVEDKDSKATDTTLDAIACVAKEIGIGPDEQGNYDNAHKAGFGSDVAEPQMDMADAEIQRQVEAAKVDEVGIFNVIYEYHESIRDDVSSWYDEIFYN